MDYNDDFNNPIDGSGVSAGRKQATSPVGKKPEREPDIVTDPMKKLGFGGDSIGPLDLNAGVIREAQRPEIEPNPMADPLQRIGYGSEMAGVLSRNEPVIAKDVKVERQPNSEPKSSPLSNVTESVQVPQSTQGLIASSQRIANGPVSVVPGNPNYKAEYAAMRAKERQDMADLNEARARALALDNARYDAYYAKIAADNAARGVWKPSVFDQMITHASTVDDRPRGGDAGRVIQSAAAPAASEFTRQANLLSQKASPRNFVQEAADAEKAEIARASMGTAQQIEQIKLDQQKRLNDLGSKLAAAQDPKERERLSSSILALLGKDKPEEYQVIHVPGAESIGPDGITKLKGQDSVILFNKRSGSWQTLPVSTQGNQAAKSAGPADGSTGMYGGKHVVFRNGKWEYA